MDCPGAMMTSWNSSVNFSNGSASGFKASLNLSGKTFQASSPRKPKTKLERFNSPLPTFLILKPMPSKFSIACVPVAIL